MKGCWLAAGIAEQHLGPACRSSPPDARRGEAFAQARGRSEAFQWRSTRISRASGRATGKTPGWAGTIISLARLLAAAIPAFAPYSQERQWQRLQMRVEQIEQSLTHSGLPQDGGSARRHLSLDPGATRTLGEHLGQAQPA